MSEDTTRIVRQVAHVVQFFHTVRSLKGFFPEDPMKGIADWMSTLDDTILPDELLREADKLVTELYDVATQLLNSTHKLMG